MNIITEGLHVMQDPLSLSAVRQHPNLSQQDKPETQSFQAHGTFFFFFLHFFTPCLFLLLLLFSLLLIFCFST